MKTKHSPICKHNLSEAVDLSQKLIDLAKQGNLDCDNDGCLVLFGMMLDSGTRIRTEAQKVLDTLQTQKGNLT